MRVHFNRAPVVQVPVVENFYLYKVDPVRRKQLLKRLKQAVGRLERSPRPRTRAQQRRFEGRYIGLNRRAIQALSPTHIELLAADGKLVRNVRRPKGGLGLVLPPTAGSDERSAVTEGGEFEGFCRENPGAC